MIFIIFEMFNQDCAGYSKLTNSRYFFINEIFVVEMETLNFIGYALNQIYAYLSRSLLIDEFMTAC